jgi:release factor glutamine methyltransferase
VRLAAGDWFAALPQELRGAVDLVVANPPYVGEAETLPAEVADWEPAAALVAGPTGLEAVAAVVAGAPAWLRRPGVLVVEIAPHQATDAAVLARAAGFASVEVRPDLTGRPRALVGRVGA